jgi:hypothetical protein
MLSATASLPHIHRPYPLGRKGASALHTSILVGLPAASSAPTPQGPSTGAAGAALLDFEHPRHPGHTPGQVAVELRGTDRTALITGDSIHHPVQLSHPHLTSCVDTDARQAVRSRARLLEQVADTGSLRLGTHFPDPTGGTVHTDGTRYCLRPESGTATLPSAACPRSPGRHPDA